MTDTATADGLEKRLRHARVTAINDDLSEPQTEKRTRHIERTEVMAEAADALAAKDAELDAADQLATALHATGEQLQAELIAKDAIIEKAKVALAESAYRRTNVAGTEIMLCVSCHEVRPFHAPTCPIGAALEAMK